MSDNSDVFVIIGIFFGAILFLITAVAVCAKKRRITAKWGPGRSGGKGKESEMGGEVGVQIRLNRITHNKLSKLSIMNIESKA